jgi:HEAT repeat protein
MVQRFSLVQRPTSESVQYIAASYREASSVGDRAASAYALGASAGNLARSGGDRAVVRASEAKLVEGAKGAKTPAERRNMLGALGNLGLPEDEATIASFAKDEAPEVRSAAAWALRKIDDEDARSALFAIAADADPSVATNAFQAIGYQTMTPDDWSSLARVVAAGTTPPQSDEALLTLLSQNVNGGAPVAQMLQTLAARNTSDNSMEARIAHVLHDVQ